MLMKFLMVAEDCIYKSHCSKMRSKFPSLRKAIQHFFVHELIAGQIVFTVQKLT